MKSKKEKYAEIKRKVLRLGIKQWLIIWAVLIFTLLFIRRHYQTQMYQMKQSYQSSVDEIRMNYDGIGDLVVDIRKDEYDILVARADIISNQNMIEQNIDTAYQIILGKSASTKDDIMIHVIEERIKYVKQYMTPADLLQAIEILRENFPNVSYDDLDNVYRKTERLVNCVTLQKERYNRLIREYDEKYKTYKSKLDLIQYQPLEFEPYVLSEISEREK